MGRQIRGLCETKQIVCITHLAQIAAHADEHYRVEKQVVGGRTRTTLRRLPADARREEVLTASAQVTGPMLATIDRADLDTTIRTLQEITRRAGQTNTTEGNR